jgi:signal peptide peptidase-like protein 2B
VLAAIIPAAWYYWQAETWSWLLQDFMGISVCLCFLNAVRLPNLQVATILLTLAFLYDIFFVFVSPLIFGSSVMVHVATGGDKPSHDDENFCEKYPNNRDCQNTALPNLIVVPAIDDYRGGDSLLGLGDIIIPGLFLVLIAR